MKVIYQDTCLSRSKNERALIVAQGTCGDERVAMPTMAVEVKRHRELALRPGGFTMRERGDAGKGRESCEGSLPRRVQQG